MVSPGHKSIHILQDINNTQNVWDLKDKLPSPKCCCIILPISFEASGTGTISLIWNSNSCAPLWSECSCDSSAAARFHLVQGSQMSHCFKVVPLFSILFCFLCCLKEGWLTLYFHTLCCLMPFTLGHKATHNMTLTQEETGHSQGTFRNLVLRKTHREKVLLSN